MTEIEVRIIVVDILHKLAKDIDKRADHQYKMGNMEAGLALSHVSSELFWQSARMPEEVFNVKE